MHFEGFSFGSIRIDGTTYEHDVVIDRGHIRKRNKKPSKKFRDTFGHTPLPVKEDIPWKCQRLVIGTGAGALPVMEEVKRIAGKSNWTYCRRPKLLGRYRRPLTRPTRSCTPHAKELRPRWRSRRRPHGGQNVPGDIWSEETL
jgi:hypothetical protein